MVDHRDEQFAKRGTDVRAVTRVLSGVGGRHLSTLDGYTKAESELISKGLSHCLNIIAILNDPPLPPVVGCYYIVGTAPTGDFAGHAGEIAHIGFDATATSQTGWVFVTPMEGEAHHLALNHTYTQYVGGKWKPLPPEGYTKAEVDGKLSAIVTGLSHSTPVIGIVSAPPATPVADEFYIVGPTPTGAFAGKVNQIAHWDGKAWVFTAPRSGEARMVESEKATYAWNGTAWVKIASGPPPIQSMTKAAYDALATKDPNVIYLTY